MDIFLILPNQLFDKKILLELDHKININNSIKQTCQFILWEHPHYFTKYNYNKKKLMLHRGSMKYYFDYLNKNNFKVAYFTFEKIPDINNYFLFDPIDDIKLPNKYEIIQSPNFLLSNELCEKYRNKSKKFLFNAFYMFGKKELDIIPEMKSQDKLNRSKMPENIDIPQMPSNKSDLKYIKKAANYVNTNFNRNCGNVDRFIFPLTHNTAKKFLTYFIDFKFKHFGDYQDSINEKNQYMFHSLLSASINIGLLNPCDIIETIMPYKNKIDLNNFEGFIRQLFWREYQRYCHIYYDFNKKNFFGNVKKLNAEWYTGKLGIKPVDDCIISGFNLGYLNHINRLMVVGNYMNLSGISPKEGFKWFMEFSCDSYEWVMKQNVYEMVFFISGGDTMRKPYISSSNYILKMSNYKRGEWCELWDKKYYDFLKKHKKLLWKFRYHFPMLNNLEKKEI